MKYIDENEFYVVRSSGRPFGNDTKIHVPSSQACYVWLSDLVSAVVMKASSVCGDKGLVAISHYLFSRHCCLILLFILKVTCVLCWYKFLFRFVLNCNRINSSFYYYYCFASLRSCFPTNMSLLVFNSVFVRLRVLLFPSHAQAHARAVRLCRTSDQSSSCLITINNKLHAFSVHFFVIYVSSVRCVMLDTGHGHCRVTIVAICKKIK